MRSKNSFSSLEWASQAGLIASRMPQLIQDGMCYFPLLKHGEWVEQRIRAPRRANVRAQHGSHDRGTHRCCNVSHHDILVQHFRLTLYSDWYTEKMFIVSDETQGQCWTSVVDKLIAIPFTINHSSSRITSCLSCSGT